MSPSEKTQRPPPLKRTLAAVVGDRHFMVAAVILAVAAAGWGMTIRLLQWVTQKEPVPWARAVRVDGETRRLLSLPSQLGPYAMPDKRAEIVLRDEQLELAGMKTGYDNEERVARRRSNWYVIRTYRDERDGSGPRAWQLAAYYYTGGIDKVPHVPERCLVAAGARWLGTTDITFNAPGMGGPWEKPVFRRAMFAQSGRKFVQYYIFSLNGRPEGSWEVVRATLSLSPWMKYCYFAKIQFAPKGEVTDLDQTDRAAAEFAKHFLPSMLEMLPTAKDVERLNSGS